MTEVANRSKLTPDLRKRKTGTTSRALKYWIGVIPTCPVSYITCGGGLAFNKVDEELVSPMGSGGAAGGGTKKQRVPVVGTIVFIDEARMRRLRDEIPRVVVRFDSGVVPSPIASATVTDGIKEAPKGSIHHTMPADVEQQSLAMGMPGDTYEFREGDANGAEFMFMVLCDDQKNGSRGDVYPETIDKHEDVLNWPMEAGKQPAAKKLN